MLGALLIALMLAAAQDALDSGRQALQAGDLTRAEQLFRQFLAQNPNSAEALSNLGAVCARREQFSEAVNFYGRALKADPKLVPVHFNMAIALGQQVDVPLPTTSVANELLTATRAMGMADRDFAVLFFTLARLAGLDAAPTTT